MSPKTLLEPTEIEEVNQACTQLVASISALVKRTRQIEDQFAEYRQQSADPKHRYDTTDNVLRNCNLPRYLLFELVKKGEIRSIALPRKPGSKRIRRLIDLDSLDAYLDNYATKERSLPDAAAGQEVA
jgi:hypothetical protein